MNSWQLALSVYKTFGRDAAKRFLTPPKSFVEKTIPQNKH